MKTTLFALIVSACLLFAVGCNKTDDSEKTTENTDNSVEQTEAIKTDDPKTDTEEEIPHWKLSCRPIKSHAQKHFSLGKDDLDISLSISDEWNLTYDGAMYNISRDENSIGSICMGSLEDDSWSVVEDYTRKQDSEFSVKKFIEKKGSGSSVCYRYRFEYIFSATSPITVSLCVDYTELDANAADRLYQSVKICGTTTVKDGMLGDIADGNYLVLGNSFIGTSNIGELLRDMFRTNQKSNDFRAISRGYANVGTYTSDATLMREIENGQYTAVFICGFYSDGEADNLVLLENACKASDTVLVIFPAHNEFDNPISLARKKCPSLPFLDWRGELNMLIESGVDKWDLCINDQHLHSTSYAGLIGAHMIYRAIYGEIPSIDGMYSIDTNRAKEIFGDYLESGRVSLGYEVYRFD